MNDVSARVLIVEDDEGLADALGRGLGTEGFEVSLAHDGTVGLSAAQEGGFDVIVLDLMLPGVSGFRFCEVLRKSGDNTPVLVLTAKEGDWDEAEALEMGADDYLRKPVSFVVLVAHLRALLRRHRRQHQNMYRAGDLCLDVSAHRCHRGDTEIDLTVREFALLELLFSRSGQAVTRREILDEVWDWAITEGSNLVDVYIGYVRRKIDAPFDRHAIQTVRGVGYRLDPDGG
jgi:two-component system OmpR family response regulator